VAGNAEDVAGNAEDVAGNAEDVAGNAEDVAGARTNSKSEIRGQQATAQAQNTALPTQGQ